jgi:pyruvate dehydrogenase E2 component (dihydrolipoamide acetyltransferase)
MATRVILPLLGQTMEEGTMIKWFKQEGETVQKGEPLLEVMTDKVNMEVESPASGTLRKILAPPEAVVPVKDLIAIIGTPDEPIDELLPGAAGKARKGEAASEPAGASQPGKADQPGRAKVPLSQAAGSAGASPSPGSASGRVFASPRARKTADEMGVSIAAMVGRGTGPEGRIVDKDVLAYAAEMKAASAQVAERHPEPVEGPRATPLAAKIAADQGLDLSALTPTGAGGKVTRDDVLRAARPPAERPKIGRVIRMAGMRKSVADNVSKSIREAPHVTLVSEVDMTECAKLRRQIGPDMEKRFGVRISFNDLVVKAAAEAVFAVPIVNSTFDGEQITVHDEVNVGIAVALEDGLMAPAVKNVQSLSLPALSAAIRDLATRAREMKATTEELQCGIIVPPQAAILGVCRIVEKPVVVDGKVEVRSMMNLCLSFDHRVMDGAPAAEYLREVKRLLEAPYLLLM